MYDDDGTSEKQLSAELRGTLLASDQNNERRTRHGDCFRICSYTARTVASNTDLDILLENASRIKYNVIALQNTMMKSPDIRQLDDGSLIIRGGKNVSRNEGGVGFIVHPSANLHVRSKKIISPYLAILRLQLPHGKRVSIINCYSPTNATASELDEFFGKLEKLICEERAFYKFVIGNFRACIGKAIEGEYRIGKHGIGERDENGNRLAGLLSTARLFHGNSFFQKKERLRWTWKSPDDTVHAEIDHFLTNRRWCLFDVSVLPAFPSESGHRLLRAKVRLSKTLEEEWLKRKKKVNDENIPDDVLQQLVCHVEEKLSYNSKHVDEEI